MNSTLNTVELSPNASMSDVMRRFKAEPGARLLRAIHRKGERLSKMNPGRWAIQFLGIEPNLNGLTWSPPLDLIEDYA